MQTSKILPVINVDMYYLFLNRKAWAMKFCECDTSGMLHHYFYCNQPHKNSFHLMKTSYTTPAVRNSREMNAT